MPKQYSHYVLVVDNLSSATPTKEVAYEFEAAGKIRDIARDYKARCAIIEFDRASDAKWAWNKMDGFRMDGRRWKVDWASRDDFDMFRWKWFEGGRSPSPRTAREDRAAAHLRDEGRRSDQGRHRQAMSGLTISDDTDYRDTY
jgi:arginine/serine-rich splicing factor 2